MKCSVSECVKASRAKGLCSMHYQRYKKHGNTATVLPSTGGQDDTIGLWGLRQRFLDQVFFEPLSGCWLWTGGCNSDGYGSIRIQGRWFSTHRYSYIVLVGEPGEGLELDHLCETRICVNPAHLEPVTPYENKRRTGLRRKTCGGEAKHPRTEDSTYKTGVNAGRCKECVRESTRKYKNRKRRESR